MASCGSCNLCCTVMGVIMLPLEDEIKPAYETCKFMCPSRKGSCSVYADRPTTCRTWKCVWLETQSLHPTIRLPAFLRPDKTGVVLEGNSKGTLVAHCETGDEWMQNPMYSYLRKMARKGFVVVGSREDYKRLNADGSITELVRLGCSENGEVMYIQREDLRV